MSDLYRKTAGNDTVEENQMKNIIRVVPSPFWLILLGVVIIMAAVLIWTLAGWRTVTVSANAIYHPGASEEGEVLCFIGMDSGKSIREGMSVSVYPSGCDQSQYGHMTGRVTYVEPYITSAEEVLHLLGDETLAATYTKYGPLVCVICKIDEDPDSDNGYLWTNEKGNSVMLADGTPVKVSIVIAKERPTLSKLQ